MARCVVTAALLGMLAVGGCSRSTPGGEKGRIVFVSIDPQAYFVERVAGDRVSVRVLVPPGQSHERYDPSARQVADLSRAAAYFTMGLPFEKALVPRVLAVGSLTVVDSAAGIPKRRIESAAHGEGEHDHAAAGGDDPHVWLDPVHVKAMARTVCDVLSRLDPAGADRFEANLAILADDLDRAAGEVARILEPARGKAIYVFHPAFGYFTDRFGLRQEAIEVEGKEPALRQLEGLIERAKAGGVTTIFVQREFGRTSAEKVAEEIGARVVTVEPLSKDYIANLVKMARAFAQGASG